jgi:hypothetical protein
VSSCAGVLSLDSIVCKRGVRGVGVNSVGVSVGSVVCVVWVL